MSQLVGLDGGALTREKVEAQEAVNAGPSFEDAERAGELVHDIDALDPHGVRYFYPLNHGKNPDGSIADPEAAKLAGTRLSRDLRKRIWKDLKEQKAQEEAMRRQPFTRGQMDEIMQYVLAPMERAQMSSSLFVAALKQVLISKGIISEDEIRASSMLLQKEKNIEILRQQMEKTGMPAEQIDKNIAVMIENMEKAEQMRAEQAASAAASLPTEDAA